MNQGSQHHLWKGGRHIQPDGYVELLIPGTNGRRRLEHRVIAEEMLGRKLCAGEVVHHKNGIRNDNRRENLEVLQRNAHSRMHNRRSAKLSIEKARTIRELYATDEYTKSALARQFGVSVNLICEILNGNIWRE